jgi:hypothetical protein
VTIHWTHVTEKGDARAAAAAKLAVDVPPAVPMTNVPSVLQDGAYVAASEPGLFQIFPYSTADEERAVPALATASPVGAVARMWAAIGTPARAAAALVVATGVVVGGYAHSRRKLRMRAGAASEQARGEGAEPVEFPLR